MLIYNNYMEAKLTWDQVNFAIDLSIKSQWEKIERRFFWTNTIRNTQTSGYR